MENVNYMQGLLSRTVEIASDKSALVAVNKKMMLAPNRKTGVQLTGTQE